MGSGINPGILVAIVVGCAVAIGAGVILAIQGSKGSDNDGDKRG